MESVAQLCYHKPVEFVINDFDSICPGSKVAKAHGRNFHECISE